MSIPNHPAEENAPATRRRTVAIVGASQDRTKYGNKSVRAHLRAGFQVFPVNPRGGEIEGLTVYPSVEAIPVPLDRVSLYVPPEIGIQLIAEIARKGCSELWLNPGSDSELLVNEARRLGLEPIQACSIVDVQ